MAAYGPVSGDAEPGDAEVGTPDVQVKMIK